LEKQIKKDKETIIMDEKERVLRAIEFSKPDKVPIEWWTMESEIDLSRSDIAFVAHDGIVFRSQIEAPLGRKRYMDIWSCIWEQSLVNPNIGQVVIHPLADISSIDTYRFPTFTREHFLSITTQINRIKSYGNKFIFGFLGNLLWERLHFLRGMENVMLDFYLNPELVEFLGDKIVDIHCEELEYYKEYGVDGVAFCDDWGTQKALQISPNTWRKFFKPRYKRLFDKAHDLGLKVYMHSCGWIFEIIEDLIEIGLDIIQLDQPELFGIDKLSEEYGGRICFCCTVDIQKILPSRDLCMIEESVKKMIAMLGKFDGGFIARAYPQPRDIGVTSEIHNAVYSLFQKYGKYSTLGENYE
jgi:hypothetical protein